jgi:hypothetical protein
MFNHQNKSSRCALFFRALMVTLILMMGVTQVGAANSYSLLFSCTDPYGGTGNDYELAKQLFNIYLNGGESPYAQFISSRQVSLFCTAQVNQKVDIDAKSSVEVFAKKGGVDYLLVRPTSNTVLGVIGR